MKKYKDYKEEMNLRKRVEYRAYVVSPIHALNKEKPAYRDIFGNKMRHLAKANGEFSMAQFDNENPHQRLPCVFGIHTKHLANHYSDYNYANGENPGKL